MITGASCSSLSSLSGAWSGRQAARRAATRSATSSSSGVSSMVMATTAISSEAVRASITPRCWAAWKTTKPNSPPWASSTMKTGRSPRGMGITRAITHSTRALSPSTATTSSSTMKGRCSTTEKSMLMPTAMKNRPSSRPLKGSRSVSSSRRYSLSASSTPARKAPRAIDRPTASISAAVATTSSSAAAVKISGVLLRAIQRRAGRSSRRPPSTMPAMTATAFSAPTQPWPAWCWPAISGTMARMGMAAMSCSRATLSTLWPEVVLVRLRSANTPRPMAVEDRARPSATTRPRCQSTPASMATPVISAAEASSCTLPQPKMGRRRAQSRRGSSSSPTRKSISTTPNSAKCSMSWASVTRARPQGPIRMPAAR